MRRPFKAEHCAIYTGGSRLNKQYEVKILQLWQISNKVCRITHEWFICDFHRNPWFWIIHFRINRDPPVHCMLCPPGYKGWKSHCCHLFFVVVQFSRIVQVFLHCGDRFSCFVGHFFRILREQLYINGIAPHVEIKCVSGNLVLGDPKIASSSAEEEAVDLWIGNTCLPARGQFLKHWLASVTLRNCCTCEWKLVKGPGAFKDFGLWYCENSQIHPCSQVV